MPATSVIAQRLPAAIAHRSWAIDGVRAQLFLLSRGRARLSRPHHPLVEIPTPAMLWLPSPRRATLQISAGGDGFSASVAADFVQRVVGDATFAQLRPLLDQVEIVRADRMLSRVTATFAALVDEAKLLQPGAAAALGLHLTLLLVEVWRASGRGGGQPGAGSSTAQRFGHLIELHYREGLGIEDFAARLGVTRAHLHAACLRATGRTPLALVHDRLLEEACARLEQTSLSVQQVGYGLGFRDPGYFNRFFKRLTGQSPGAYRRAAAAARPTTTGLSFAAWP